LNYTLEAAGPTTPRELEKNHETMKAICTAAILAWTLSVLTYAGELLTSGFTAPPLTHRL